MRFPLFPKKRSQLLTAQREPEGSMKDCKKRYGQADEMARSTKKKKRIDRGVGLRILPSPEARRKQEQEQEQQRE